MAGWFGHPARTWLIACFSGGCDPQVVLGLHTDLAGDVGAPEPLVGQQPGRGVTVALLPVRALASTDSRFIESLANAARLWMSHPNAPVTQALPSATTWSMSTRVPSPLTKPIVIAV